MSTSHNNCFRAAAHSRVRETEDSNAVKPVCVFSDDRWTVNRSITGVDWSPKVKPCLLFSRA